MYISRWTKLIFTPPVISFSLAIGFLTDAALLGVVHHFLSCLAALGWRREEFCEGVDEALGLVVEAQAALWKVVVVPHRKKQPIVTGVTFTGGAGGRVGRDWTLPPSTPKFLEGPPRPEEELRIVVKQSKSSLWNYICTVQCFPLKLRRSFGVRTNGN